VPYPVILAGSRITAGLLSSMMPLEAYKAADLFRTTTTLADDPDLQMQLEGGATYRIQMWIYYSAVHVEQLKTAWNVPFGASGLKGSWGAAPAVSDGTPVGDGRWGIHGFTTTCVYGDRNSSNQVLARETGHVVTTGPGILALQWAQNASGSVGVRVAQGSYMTAKRIA